MDNKTYVELINNGKFPTGITVPLDNPFIDDRGTISNLWLGQSGSVTLIHSNKGSIRACHYHKNDWHACYILSGTVKYFERDLNEKESGCLPLQLNTIEQIFGPGSMFFTRPWVVHKMEFLTDTTMLTINNIRKDHDNYENSVVRVEF